MFRLRALHIQTRSLQRGDLGTDDRVAVAGLVDPRAHVGRHGLPQRHVGLQRREGRIKGARDLLQIRTCTFKVVLRRDALGAGTGKTRVRVVDIRHRLGAELDALCHLRQLLPKRGELGIGGSDRVLRHVDGEVGLRDPDDQVLLRLIELRLGAGDDVLSLPIGNEVSRAEQGLRQLKGPRSRTGVALDHRCLVELRGPGSGIDIPVQRDDRQQTCSGLGKLLAGDVPRRLRGAQRGVANLRRVIDLDEIRPGGESPRADVQASGACEPHQPSIL